MVKWISSLLGEDMPPAVGVIAMFALAILAIGFLLWIAKRILGGTFVAGGRARHLRLAVMDATPVDSRRRLVLVRRDDVEHLILIGGPTDVVVEQNIRLSPTAAAKPAMSGGPSEDTLQKTETISETRETVGTTTRAEPVQAKTNAPAIQVPERPAVPVRPQPAAPVRPAPLQPKPLEPARTYPQPVATMPPRPARAYVPPSNGPAAGLSGSSYQPRPITPPSPPVAPAIMPAAQEPVTDPMVKKAPNIEQKTVAAAVAPVAAVVLPEATKPVELVETETLNPDANDSLLLDLSDEIARVAGIESEAPEISLEEEMESLLADLDVKAERTT